MVDVGPTCDALWLPACPVCSNVQYWKRPGEDNMEFPFFVLARRTTERKGACYWFLTGCTHAAEMTKRGPKANRLRIAIRWRKTVDALIDARWKDRYTDDQRLILANRFKHPAIDLILEDAEL